MTVTEDVSKEVEETLIIARTSKPLLDTYVHSGLGSKFDQNRLIKSGTGCGNPTKIDTDTARLYIRHPDPHRNIFCGGCRRYFLSDNFVWKETSERVGS